tara:strand:+ start:3596 stop:4489 length:894 start_codon:yes stop_codon:yes gene_type:complete
MSQKILYGLENYFKELIKLYDNKKLPKVIMLTGSKGQGKFTLIHHLLAYIFDIKNYNLKLKKINEESKVFNVLIENYNPNIIYFECIGKKIKIDDIRELRKNLQKSSINHLPRFIIFDDVENLNDSCINALLKTIEEPSITNYFILINNKSQTILDTLKSRSIELKFFLNQEKKKLIINKLIKNFKIEEKINLNNITLTPGNYLKFNKIIFEEQININDDLITNIEKLLKLNKIKKNNDYSSLAIYLIDCHYYKKSKNKSNIGYFNDKRIEIIKKINETNKFNLNQVNVITDLKNYI